MISRIIFIALALSIFASCSEDFFYGDVEFDLGEENQQIAVMARLINTDLGEDIPIFDYITNLGVLVSKTRSILDTTEFELIQNALVTLIDDQGNRESYEFDEPSGYYFPENFIETGQSESYTIEVEVPGLDMIRSTVVVPAIVDFADFEFFNADIAADGDTLDKIEFTIAPSSPGENYLLEAFYETKDVLMSDTIVDWRRTEVFSFDSAFSDDANLFNGESISESNPKFEFWVERPFFRRSFDSIDRVVFVLWNLSDEEYEFRKSLSINQDANDNPFQEPSILFDNIENGIGAFSISYLQMKVVEL